MKILVLSDFHIDTLDKFGIFQWDQDELINWIERLKYEHEIDQIILNGDIFELYKYKMEDIQRVNSRLVEYLKRPYFVYIKGNHDIINHEGLESHLITNSSGQTIYIEHGHKADWLNGTALGRNISKVALNALKALSSSKLLLNVYFKIVELDDQVNHIPKKYNSYKYLTYALRLLKQYDVVILAHTHKLETHHTYYLNKKKKYLNCGSCSLGRFQAIVMDTETLKYDTIKTNKKDIKLQNTPSLQTA